MTGLRFTGQRMQGTGLYDYGGGTRWYDPMLGRWAQPDSVVPLASQGVQAWDRYAGMNNNPVRYNDPSGQSIACGEGGDTGACGGETKESIYFEKRQNHLDCWAGKGGANCSGFSRMQPDAIGIQAGYWIQSGFFVEPGHAGELFLVYNPHTGELSIGVTGQIGYKAGTPSGIGGGGYVGVSVFHNISENSSLEGASGFVGGDISADAIGTIGGSYSHGVGNVDRGTGDQVTYDSMNVAIGANLAPNAVEWHGAGGIAGSQIWRTWLIR